MNQTSIISSNENPQILDPNTGLPIKDGKKIINPNTGKHYDENSIIHNNPENNEIKIPENKEIIIPTKDTRGAIKDIMEKKVEESSETDFTSLLGMSESGIIFNLKENPSYVHNKLFKSLKLTDLTNFNEYIYDHKKLYISLLNSTNEVDLIFDKLIEFYKRYSSIYIESKSDFLEKFIFLKKFTKFKNSQGEIKNINLSESHISFFINEFCKSNIDQESSELTETDFKYNEEDFKGAKIINNDFTLQEEFDLDQELNKFCKPEKSISDEYIETILYHESDRINFENAKILVEKLNKDFNLSSDLAQDLLRKYPQLKTQNDEKILEEITKGGYEKILYNLRHRINLANNQENTFNEIPNTKVGIEFEFYLPKEKNIPKEIIETLLKYKHILYENPDYKENYIWKDLQVHEFAIGGQKGLKISKEYKYEIQKLIKEIESNNKFIYWASNHGHFDEKSILTKKNSLFYFNNLNCVNKKGLETKELPLCTKENMQYSLEINILFDQISIIGMLYEENSENLIEKLYPDTNQLIYELGQSTQYTMLKILLKVAENKPHTIPAILRLYEKRKLPLVNFELIKPNIKLESETLNAIAKIKAPNIQGIISKKINNIPFSFENLMFISNIEDNYIVENFAKKFSKIPSCYENIEIISKIQYLHTKKILYQKLEGSISFSKEISEIIDKEVTFNQRILIEKLENNIPFSSEITELMKNIKNQNNKELLIKKVETITGNLENLKLIFNIEDEFTISLFSEKLKIPSNIENLEFISKIENDLIRLTLYEKVYNIEKNLEFIFNIVSPLDKVNILLDLNIIPFSFNVIEFINSIEQKHIKITLLNKIIDIHPTKKNLEFISNIKNPNTKDILYEKVVN